MGTEPVRQTVIRVSCVQVAHRDEESKEERVARVLSFLASMEATDLIVLPELWATGYFHFGRYAEEAEELAGPTSCALGGVAARLGVHLLAGSFVERGSDGQLFNTAVLFAPDGQILLAYRKVHLFSYESDERLILSPGSTAEVVSTPIGRLAVTTCYDLRFPELYRYLVDRGAEVVVVPAAWPLRRADHWSLLVRARAIENQVFVVACNGSGVDNGTALAGRSTVVGPAGEVLAEADANQSTLQANLDLVRLAADRRDFPVLADRCIPVGEGWGR